MKLSSRLGALGDSPHGASAFRGLSELRPRTHGVAFPHCQSDLSSAGGKGSPKLRTCSRVRWKASHPLQTKLDGSARSLKSLRSPEASAALQCWPDRRLGSSISDTIWIWRPLSPAKSFGAEISDLPSSAKSLFRVSSEAGPQRPPVTVRIRHLCRSLVENSGGENQRRRKRSFRALASSSARGFMTAPCVIS